MNSLWNVNRGLFKHIFQYLQVLCLHHFYQVYDLLVKHSEITATPNKYICFVALLPAFIAQFLFLHHCLKFLKPLRVFSWYWTLQTDRKLWRTFCLLLNDHTHHFVMVPLQPWRSSYLVSPALADASMCPQLRTILGSEQLRKLIFK